MGWHRSCKSFEQEPMKTRQAPPPLPVAPSSIAPVSVPPRPSASRPAPALPPSATPRSAPPPLPPSSRRPASHAVAPSPPRLPARDFDTLPDADVMTDADAAPSAPPPLPPARRRTRARRSLLKLIGAAGALMALAGTAFAMHSQADHDQSANAPSGVPSVASAGAAAQPTHELVGPSAEARELKFQKDPNPTAKHAPTTKSRSKAKPKAKASSPRHA